VQLEFVSANATMVLRCVLCYADVLLTPCYDLKVEGKRRAQAHGVDAKEKI
jgi:hypothetical protein